MPGKRNADKLVNNRRRGGLLNDIARDKQLYIMLIPFVAFYILFAYVPMYWLQIAFRDYNVVLGLGDSPWVGFDQFVRFFTHPWFFRIVRNTLLISIYSILWGFPIPITLAILLNEVRRKRLRNAFQTFVMVPHFVSVVVVVGIVMSLLSPGTGIVNNIIQLFGGEPIYFMIEPGWFRTVFITMQQWQGAGFNSIIYLAAIAGIDQQLYEAATIDGANKWKQIKHITFPGILPTFIMLLIMRMGSMLQVGFEPVLLLQRPITFETADIISTFAYREGLEQGNHSFAAAIELFNGAVGLVLVTTANYISKRVTETSLW